MTGPVPTGGPAVAQYRFECLPDTFHVASFEAVEALNEPYRLTVHLIADEEATDSYELLGMDAVLFVAMKSSERAFRGIVDRVTIGNNAQRLQTCTVTVVPALFALSRTLNTRIFQDKTALEIVDDVLTESLTPYGRKFRLDAVDASRLVTRNYCVQYRETNLAFVHRLLEEEGIGYYFQHDTETETLFLFDDNRSLAQAEPSRVEYWTAGSAWMGADRIVSFVQTSSRTATSLTTRDYDWRRSGGSQLESTGPLTAADLRRSHEVYEHGVGQHHVIHEDTTMLLGMVETLVASLIGANLPAPIADRMMDLKGSIFDRFSSSNTEDRGRVRREWQERDAHVFEGISFIPGLSAGAAFDLVGHPTQDTDGEYYVTHVTHSSQPPPSIVYGSELDDHVRHLNYHNRVRCLPRSTAWRPDRLTPKPRIEGVQTATVTGPMGLDVYTDPHGRIKVRFPWDRADADLNGHYTCWLRVGQTWAGQTAPAFLFIPRVGMEVIVSFVDGDPDRPLVIGCVYNGDNATPGMLPPQATKSIIRTRTIPQGTGYNELSFEDAMGLERVYLRAERDLAVLVQRNRDVRIYENERMAVGASQMETIEIDRHVMVGRNDQRTVAGSSTEETMGDLTRSVQGVVNDHFQHGYQLRVEEGGVSSEAKGEWSAKGGTGITLIAGSSVLRMTDEEQLGSHGKEKGLTLTSFGSVVHLSQDRIELKVGSSSIVITPETVQINGKTLPTTPSDEPSTSSSETT